MHVQALPFALKPVSVSFMKMGFETFETHVRPLRLM